MPAVDVVGSWALVGLLLTWIQRTLERKLDALAVEQRATTAAVVGQTTTTAELVGLLERAEQREMQALHARAAVAEEFVDEPTGVHELPGASKRRKLPRGKTSTVVDMDGRPIEKKPAGGA